MACSGPASTPATAQGFQWCYCQPLLLQRFLQQDVTWVDLQALASKPDLDPLLALLTLPVQKEPDLAPCAQRILAPRPDLIALILPILSERFQGLSPQQIIATLGISKDFWRHTRAFQDILAEGRQEGLEQGRRREASALALRLLQRRCGSLEVANVVRAVNREFGCCVADGTPTCSNVGRALHEPHLTKAAGAGFGATDQARAAPSRSSHGR